MVVSNYVTQQTVSMTDQPTRKRGRPKAGDEQPYDQEVLLDLALEVFADLGYEATSVRDLSRRIGVSHGLLHAKFGSKHNIWEAAVNLGLSRLGEQIQRATVQQDCQVDVAERLRLVFIAFLLGVADAPAVLKLMNYEGARQSERLDYIADRYFSQSTTPINGLLQEGIAAGVFREVALPTLFLLLAHGGGALFGLRPLAKKLGVPEKRSPQTLRSQAESIADLLVRGMRV